MLAVEVFGLLVRGGPLPGCSPGHAADRHRQCRLERSRVTSVVGTAQFVGGILGLTLGGWLGDTFGAKKSTIAVFAALMAVSAAMWFSVANWGDPTCFTAFVYARCGLTS